MTAPDALPGSRFDEFPLLVCHNCKRSRERSGGVFSGARFVCRACFAARNFRSGRLAGDSHDSAVPLEPDA